MPPKKGKKKKTDDELFADVPDASKFDLKIDSTDDSDLIANKNAHSDSDGAPITKASAANKGKKGKKSKNAPKPAPKHVSDNEDPEDDHEEDIMPRTKPTASASKNAYDAFTDDEVEEREEVEEKQDKMDEDKQTPLSPIAQLNDSVDELSLGAKKKSKRKQKKDSEIESPPPMKVEKIVPQYADADDMSDEDAMGKKHSADGTFTSKNDFLTATGILLSQERSKDVQIDKFTFAAYGTQLVKDTSISLLYGRKYGLIGANGAGKSTLLRCLAHREVPIQSNIDIYLLEREYDPTELTAVQAVVDIVKVERETLENEMDELLMVAEGHNSSRFEFINERLNELDLSFAEQKARAVLHGLGFTEEMQDMKTKEFSGGWRMRVALARALFVKPTVLLLDDATNHLDLSAVVWLEEYLLTYPHTVVMVSHSQDFLNSICNEIMYLNIGNQKLEYFSGNYDSFMKVKSEMDEGTKKRAKADEKKIKKIKESLGRTGTAAKQAKSHMKTLNKRMEKAGDAIADMQAIRVNESKISIYFKDCGGGLPSPFLKFNDVAFSYPGREQLYHDLNFGIDLKSRIALVGPNGVGKTTMMKLMCGQLQPTEGAVYRHHHLKIARFHQHLTEQLNLQQSAVEWLCNEFDEIKAQQMRTILGQFGLTGKSQTMKMEQLSDGQLRRVVFTWLSKKNCHLLMLDEPTNFLDPETIDALADGIKAFDGGVVLISHDFRLIDKVAEEIWVLEDGTVDEWDGTIQEYKDYLKKKVEIAE